MPISLKTGQSTVEGIIGKNNNYTEIRDSREGVAQGTALTPQILNCDEVRAFWISFAYNHYYVGTGALKT